MRFAAMQSQAGVLHCFVLDCSASMLKNDGLKLAKGVLLACFDQAAAKRDHVALICFGGERADVRFGPAVPRWWNERWLGAIGGGGGTPLTYAVSAATKVIDRARRRRPQQQRVLWLFTDGRTAERPMIGAGGADRIVVVDCERSQVRLGGCRTLASLWGAECMRAEEMIVGAAQTR